MTAESRVQVIERMLYDAFAPETVQVKDQSHLHAGHPGARDGKGHFDVMIVSDRFDGKSRIARHRLVYDALGAYMDSDIHALRIRAFTPSER
jgi:BolA protein